MLHIILQCLLTRGVRTITERPTHEVPRTPAPTATTNSPFSSARSHSMSSSRLPSIKSPVLERNASSDVLTQSPVPQAPKKGRGNSPFEYPHDATLNNDHERPEHADSKPPITPHFHSTDSSSTLISSSTSHSRERDRSQSKVRGGDISDPGSASRSSNGREFFYPSACTALSTPSSPSGGTTTLAYYLITKNLALLALIPTALYEERRGLLEYNVVFFRQGVQEICNLEEEESVVSG